MHEASIITYTLDAVRRSAAAHGVTQVDTITLVLGKLRMAYPDALQRSFALMADEPPFLGTRLNIREKNVIVRCTQCGCETDTGDQPASDCPACGGTDLQVIQGRELLLAGYTGK